MKKILSIILAVLIIVGTAMTVATGFNVDLEYAKTKKTTVYIGKEFHLADIEDTIQEIMGDQKIMLQKMRPFEDVLAITSKEINSEQIAKINEALNAKYGLENTTESFEITDIPEASLIEELKPYWICIAIFAIGIIAYEMIVYRKLGAVKVGLETFAILLATVLALLSILKICALTISTYLVSEVLVVEFIAAFGITMFFENRARKVKLEEEAEKTTKNDRKKKEENPNS